MNNVLQKKRVWNKKLANRIQLPNRIRLQVVSEISLKFFDKLTYENVKLKQMYNIKYKNQIIDFYYKFI